MEKRVILTDVDGILIKWQSGLPYFVQKYGIDTSVILETMVTENFKTASELFGFNERLSNMFLEEYNASDFIRYLSGYDDAIHVINQLKSEFDFIAITALGNTDGALMNRCFNLNTLFPGAFKDIRCVNYNESKLPHYIAAKQKYRERLVCFVDDLAHNLEDCHDAISELPLIHMIRGDEGNRKEATCPVIKVKNWYDIQQRIQEGTL